MSSWMNWFGGRRDTRETARDSIVGLRQQLLLLEKREAHLQTKIDDEMKKARANATTNKRLATNALRAKKQHETELEKLSGMRLTLEQQVNSIESANLNAETMVAMKKGADALKSIHQSLQVDKVDETMDSIREQMALAQEIQDVMVDPFPTNGVDEDELEAELEALEQEELDNRLNVVDSVPLHTPASPQGVGRVAAPKVASHADDDEEEQLRQLQAELAM